MPTTKTRNQPARCYGADCSSVDYIRDDDAESPTFCLTWIWLIATISKISVSENWRAALFVILNIAETPEMRPEHCRLRTNSFD